MVVDRATLDLVRHHCSGSPDHVDVGAHAERADASVWLTYWEADDFGKPSAFYEGMYAALGVSQAIFTFALGASLGVLSYCASNRLHLDALNHIFRAPMSVFDTQPLGRILGVFGKDVDLADNQLPDSLRMMAMTLVAVSRCGTR